MRSADFYRASRVKSGDVRATGEPLERSSHPENREDPITCERRGSNDSLTRGAFAAAFVRRIHRRGRLLPERPGSAPVGEAAVTSTILCVRRTTDAADVPPRGLPPGEHGVHPRSSSAPRLLRRCEAHLRGQGGTSEALRARAAQRAGVAAGIRAIRPGVGRRASRFARESRSFRGGSGFRLRVGGDRRHPARREPAPQRERAAPNRRGRSPQQRQVRHRPRSSSRR